MIVQFKEYGSRKLLKELFISTLPYDDSTIIINGIKYSVITSEFDTDKPLIIVWVRKVK